MSAEHDLGLSRDYFGHDFEISTIGDPIEPSLPASETVFCFRQIPLTKVFPNSDNAGILRDEGLVAIKPTPGEVITSKDLKEHRLVELNGGFVGQQDDVEALKNNKGLTEIKIIR